MSAYDAVGGSGGVRAAVAVFYQRVLDDPDLGGWFGDVDLARLKAHQRAFLGHALGGPELFGGRGLADAHAGLGITDAAFDAVVEHLVLTLHDLGVEGATLATVRAFLETRRADVVELSCPPAPGGR
ncbi:group 1 truncated hemoglobin GlbN [Nocardioides ginsengisoli]|uniref:Group 1 truncated hemoglobin n=1 Tax=Nocardioides ginsengisoli TaxID=363868 RepID=A0ABW3W580_9ACTN